MIVYTLLSRLRMPRVSLSTIHSSSLSSNLCVFGFLVNNFLLMRAWTIDLFTWWKFCSPRLIKPFTLCQLVLVMTLFSCCLIPLNSFIAKRMRVHLIVVSFGAVSLNSSTNHFLLWVVASMIEQLPIHLLRQSFCQVGKTVSLNHANEQAFLYSHASFQRQTSAGGHWAAF